MQSQLQFYITLFPFPSVRKGKKPIRAGILASGICYRNRATVRDDRKNGLHLHFTKKSCIIECLLRPKNCEIRLKIQQLNLKM